MHSRKIIDEYIDLIKNDEKKYAEDFLVTKEMVKNSTAYYKDLPVPFTYQPFFIDQKDKENFQYIVDTIYSIAKKVTIEYRKNPEYRKLFGFPKFIEDMILVDNGYGVEVPMARFDIFYKDKNNFKFCEINTDGSSAMNEDMVIGKILLQSEGLKDFSKNYFLKPFELFDSWVAECLDLYKRYNPDNKCPNVAIMDIMESASPQDFIEFKKAFERVGLNCEIVDVRKLIYRDGALYNGDYKIDLIYRRLVTFELINYEKECQDFIKAYMDQAVCTIGSIQSQVAHNKIFFKILFDEETKSLLTDEENAFIKAHIPYTGILAGDESLLTMLSKNKDDYIIKPMDRNASTGVYTGRDLSQEQWEESLRRDFGGEYIYQEFVDDMNIPFVFFDENGQIEIKELMNTTGLFSYNEKLAGLYVRLGQENIISGLTDYIAAPAILAIRRNMDDILPRINELAKIAKTRKLTAEESYEREELRKEYILRFRAGLDETLLQVKVVDQDGNDITPEKLKIKKKKRW